jgi:hypothetical protein
MTQKISSRPTAWELAAFHQLVCVISIAVFLHLAYEIATGVLFFIVAIDLTVSCIFLIKATKCGLTVSQATWVYKRLRGTDQGAPDHFRAYFQQVLSATSVLCLESVATRQRILVLTCCVPQYPFMDHEARKESTLRQLRTYGFHP